MAKQNLSNLDIRKVGPAKYYALQAANNSLYREILTEEDNPIRTLLGSSDNNIYDHVTQTVKSPLYGTKTPWGQSMFDNEFATLADFENLGDIRAENQPWYSKLGAGLAKGAVLAGTTFLDGTLGLLVGTVTAIAEERWSGIWDNPFSRATKELNDQMEVLVPNYYSTEELNRPWYENIFTSNFWGDKFIKNLGFTVGAFYSGGVYSGLSKLVGKGVIGGMAKLGASTQAIKTGLKINSVNAAMTGAFTSAVNEGRIEALNNSTDWFNYNKQILDDETIARLDSLGIDYNINNEGELTIHDSREQEIYDQTIKELAEKKLHMGNVDLALNIPILMASNLFQFGKMYSNGFDTARRGLNIKGNLGNYFSGTTAKGTALKAIGKPLSEGTEEMSQKAASEVAGNYYATDVNNFYKRQTDRDSEQETLSWIKSTSEGIAKTLSEGSSWEEFFIGALTGAMGMPKFRSIKNDQGNWQSPVYLDGGIRGDILEYQENKPKEEALVAALNARVQSPEFLNYYRGMIRHNGYQNDMNRAIFEDDKFGYKNAEHAQILSDIMMFDKANKLEDLKLAIEEVSGTSEEDLGSIVEATTVKTEDGKLSGPFAQYATEDETGNIKASFADRESVNEMADKINKNKESVLNTIKQYTDIKYRLLAESREKLNDDQLEELTWMESQLIDWSKRAASLSGEVKLAIQRILGPIESDIHHLERTLNNAGTYVVSDGEGNIDAGINPLYTNLESRIKNLREVSENLRFLNTVSDDYLPVILSSEPEYTKSIDEAIENLDNNIYSGSDKEKLHNIIQDILKIQEASKKYSEKRDEYIKNPAQQLADHQAADEQRVKEEKDIKNKDLAEAIKGAKNARELKEIIDSREDENVDDTIQNIANEGNEIAKNYLDIKQYKRHVERALDSLNLDPQTREDALSLFEDQLNHSNNLSQVANFNSVHIANDTAFDESSEGDVELSQNRFYAAQYAIQRAMSKVNNDNKFKDRFSEEYKVPIQEPSKKDSGEKAGDKSKDKEKTSEYDETPTGDISREELEKENKENNNAVSSRDNKKEVKKYYRPAIPELHIEASKEGDFRAFNIVVSEREPGVNFDTIYNYLEEKGAFKYVNEGHLHVGDSLYFMIDPAFEEQVKDNKFFTEPTIFIAHKREDGEYQIVGSLDAGSSVANFEGLESLEEKVRNEYKQSNAANSSDPNKATKTPPSEDASKKINRAGSSVEDIAQLKPGDELYFEGLTTGDIPIVVESIDTGKQPKVKITFKNEHYTIKKGDFDKLKYWNSSYKGDVEEPTDTVDSKKEPFVSTQITRVSKIMVGKIPYSTEEKNLKDIPNVLSEDREPIFGIIKNGLLVTNNAKKYDDIITPMDMSNEGRLYLLIPNAAGKYSPAAVRVKHFNKEEFDLNDVNISSTPFGKDLIKAINELAKIESEEEKNEALKLLNPLLYLKNVDFKWFENNKGKGLTIHRKVKGADGKVTDTDYKNVYFTEYTGPISNAGIMIDASVASDIPELQDQFNAVIGDKETSKIVEELTDALMYFNVPIQVSSNRINEGAYNKRLIEAGVLTSNISNAVVIDNWFTTNYFDNEGNLQEAINPKSLEQNNKRGKDPVGGSGSVVPGIDVEIDNFIYKVNLETSTITDRNGNAVNLTPAKSGLLKELAWAQNEFGDKTEAENMVDNTVLTPSGKVLNRTKKQYLTGGAVTSFKKKLQEKQQNKEDKLKIANTVIRAVEENQAKVDKTRTDSEYYYILEDDGVYHAYDRIHKRLGPNKNEKALISDNEKKNEKLNDIRKTLVKQSDNVSSFNNYLTKLENTYNISLQDFRGKIDLESREAILDIISNNYENNSALIAGSAVDSVVRQFFIVEGDVSKITKPEKMTEGAYLQLIESLNTILNKIKDNNEKFLTNNIVLFAKYEDGTRIAGEVDILAVDSEGNFKIYDVKTSKYSFYDFKQGNKTINYFKKPAPWQEISSKEYYTNQLSGYKNLFDYQYGSYGASISDLALLPYVVSRKPDGTITGIKIERGMLLSYNPNVNVPRGTNKAIITRTENFEADNTEFDTNKTLFNSLFAHMDPVNDLLPESNMEGSNPGYFIVDNKIHYGYLISLGEVAGIPVHLAKIATESKGFSGTKFIVNNYYAVLPNGKALNLYNNPVSEDTKSDKDAKTDYYNALNNNPEKLKNLSLEETEMTNEDTLNNLRVSIEDSNNSSDNIDSGGAAIATALIDQANEFNDDLEDILRLRKTTEEEFKLWDQKQELAWLSKVLPQLSENDRVKVVNGLIKVNDKGLEAWGQFDKGITTLSNIAAEGTTYHEAFHAVFNLLLDNKEKRALYKEAATMYGPNSAIGLEEHMAEGFREYVMNRQKKGLLSKIKNFFEDLWIKVTNWKKLQPHLKAYYQMINKGKFANMQGKISSIQDLENTSTDAFKDPLAPLNLNITTPIKENFKGKLIFAQSDTGKTTIADNINVIDSDAILANLLGVGTPQATRAFSLLSPQEKIKYSKLYEDSINELIAQGKTVITARLNSLDDADIIIYNDSVELTNSRTSALDRSNNFINTNYQSESLNTIKSKSAGKEVYKLKDNEHLSDIILTDKSFNIGNEIAKRFNTVDDLLIEYLKKFGFTVQEFNDSGYTIDLLDRVVRISSKSDVTEATGELIAFMSMYNSEAQQLIADLAIEMGDISSKEIYNDKGGIKTTKYRTLVNNHKYFKIIGKAIKEELQYQFDHVKERGNYDGSPVKKSWVEKIRNIITSFFDKLLNFNSYYNLTTYARKHAIQALNLNDYYIKQSVSKPGDKEKNLVFRVDLKTALDENSYERDIIFKLTDLGFSLAGSAAMSVQGSVYRPAENPLHDIDFDTDGKNREYLDKVLPTKFDNIKHVRTINQKDSEIPGCETYLTMSVPFRIERPVEGVAMYTVVDNNNEVIASFVNSELTILKKDIQGKFLDFFVNEKNKYGNVEYNYNGSKLLLSNYKNAMYKKLFEYNNRIKDIWDFNRFVPTTTPGGKATYRDALLNFNQTKSATDNVGTLSTTNNDVRFRLATNRPSEILDSRLFSSLDSNTKQQLLDAGWTKEAFDNISEEERKHALRCVAF